MGVAKRRIKRKVHRICEQYGIDVEPGKLLVEFSDRKKGRDPISLEEFLREKGVSGLEAERLMSLMATYNITREINED